MYSVCIHFLAAAYFCCCGSLNNSNIDGKIAMEANILRINISGDNELPDGVILHGKKTPIPDKYCGNCSKKFDCQMLSYALNGTQMLEYMPRALSMMAEKSSMPFPMPCEGLSWSGMHNSQIEVNPLVQRLGLTDVGQPLPGSTPK